MAPSSPSYNVPLANCNVSPMVYPASTTSLVRDVAWPARSDPLDPAATHVDAEGRTWRMHAVWHPAEQELVLAFAVTNMPITTTCAPCMPTGSCHRARRHCPRRRPVPRPRAGQVHDTSKSLHALCGCVSWAHATSHRRPIARGHHINHDRCGGNFSAWCLYCKIAFTRAHPRAPCGDHGDPRRCRHCHRCRPPLPARMAVCQRPLPDLWQPPSRHPCPRPRRAVALTGELPHRAACRPLARGGHSLPGWLGACQPAHPAGHPKLCQRHHAPAPTHVRRLYRFVHGSHQVHASVTTGAHLKRQPTPPWQTMHWPWKPMRRRSTWRSWCRCPSRTNWWTRHSRYACQTC